MTNTPKFAHLHVHTAYSLRDAVGSAEEYIKLAKSFGQTSIGVSDHGNMYGYIDFYFKAKKAGINPVLGTEMYIVADRLQKGKVTSEEKTKDEKRAYHLTLLCRNNKGYKNLIKIVSIANKEGFYYTPRADKKLLAEYSDGLVALSGCIGGELGQLILKNEFDKAEELIEEYINIFGKENYFIEIMNHGLEEQTKVNPILVKLAAKYGLKIVATNDIHYAKKEDSKIQEAVLALADHKNLNDPTARKFPCNEFYLKSTEEMLALFPDNPEYLQNAYDLAESCKVEIETKNAIFPSTAPTQKEKENNLHSLCMEGWKNVLKDSIKNNKEQRTLYGERMKYELGVINKNGFTDYFIIVADIVGYARKKKIPMSKGRGSVGGSLVAYILGITDIDPIKYDLFFERFLNPDRISPPDVDLDFSPEGRDEVVAYVKEKYGEDKVCKMITFGKYGCKQALRFALKAYGFDIEVQNRVSKLIPGVIQGIPDIEFKHVYGLEPGFEYALVPELLEAKAQYPEAFELAEKLEGIPSHASTHACSYILTDKPVTDYIPLDYDTRAEVERTGIDMYSIEKLGLLKMDFLSVETLGVIESALEMISDRTGKLIVREDFPEGDKNAWDLLKAGDTIGIFQFESDGMRGLLKKAKPNNINELADCNAIYRPGAMAFIPDYCMVKGGFKEPEYFHELMKPVLKNTYGIMIYQEQVMKMCQVLAGFSLPQADYMRKAIGKKKKEDMDILKPKFAAGCERNGIDQGLVEQILDWFSAMSRYNFNKSHAVGYSLNAYDSAYVKANYPLEFFTAFLNKDVSDIDEYAIRTMDARRRGVTVLPPSINLSDEKASIKEESIVLGLGMIKSVNGNTLSAILKMRTEPFKSYEDFISRCASVLDKKAIVGLAASGALDCLKVPRKWAMETAEAQLKDIRKETKKAQKKECTPDFSKYETLKVPMEFEDYTKEERCALEREYVGMIVSESPLVKYKYLTKRDDFFTSVEISKLRDEADVLFVGMMDDVRESTDKNGNKMGFIQLTDDFGKVKGLVFATKYPRFKPRLKKDKVWVWEGKISRGAILINNIRNPDDF